jgi:arylsulfatase A-like enzyme
MGRAVFFAACFLLASRCLAADFERPNVIVILTDDQGFADLGVQASLDDVKTPHLDALAQSGVRMSNGYVSAPQCTPSRAGLICGRYQNRFGLETNADGPLSLEERTIAERLIQAGYISGMVGKWHLDQRSRERLRMAQDRHLLRELVATDARGRRIAADARRRDIADPRFLPAHQGFEEFFCGLEMRYVASHDLDGNSLAGKRNVILDGRFRVDVQTRAALSFIDRHAKDRFFLFVSYYAPHVPLVAAPRYLERFAHVREPRRTALAMISAMDDGVGKIVQKLRDQGLEQETLIFFLSDNGAPLQKGRWNGSKNDPLVGGKGMLTDGGIRVPFIATWPGMLPSGKVYEHPVISLDIASTMAAVAGLPYDERLDGVNLMPYLRGENNSAPHDALYWRWRSQAAIRAGRWKFLRLGADHRFLFDLEHPHGESRNVAVKHPMIAVQLERKLQQWSAQLVPAGLPTGVNPRDKKLFENHLDAD